MRYHGRTRQICHLLKRCRAVACGAPKSPIGDPPEVPPRPHDGAYLPQFKQAGPEVYRRSTRAMLPLPATPVQVVAPCESTTITANRPPVAS